MAAYDFPPTAGEPTDGSFTYTAPTGEIYSWNGYSWVMPAGPSTPDAFVKKSGDTMTGDLTVPNLTVPGVIDNKQVACAYGTISNAGVLTYTHNIGAARLVGTNAYDIDFATPRPDQSYVVVASIASSRASNNDPAVVLTCNQRSSTTFRITVRKLTVSGSNVVQGPGELVAVSFAVYSVN